MLFAVAFAANHGFNNFSLSMLEVSLNLVLRSCIPLMTVLLQATFRQIGVPGFGESVLVSTTGEMIFMFLGVMCAALATISQHQGSTNESQQVLFGTAVGILSIVFAAFNMLCAAELGGDLKISPLDATCYCALPASIFLSLPIFLLRHSSWPGFAYMTDWQVYEKVYSVSPATMILVLISGLMSVGYSFLQYWLIMNLSAAYTAFAGNFNKGICIVISIWIGLETLPQNGWGVSMVLAVVGNAAAFTGYSLLRAQTVKKTEGVEDKIPEGTQ